jgi:hypothetical protein
MGVIFQILFAIVGGAILLATSIIEAIHDGFYMNGANEKRRKLYQARVNELKQRKKGELQEIDEIIDEMHADMERIEKMRVDHSVRQKGMTELQREVDKFTPSENSQIGRKFQAKFTIIKVDKEGSVFLERKLRYWNRQFHLVVNCHRNLALSLSHGDTISFHGVLRDTQYVKESGQKYPDFHNRTKSVALFHLKSDRLNISRDIPIFYDQLNSFVTDGEIEVPKYVEKWGK